MIQDPFLLQLEIENRKVEKRQGQGKSPLVFLVEEGERWVTFPHPSAAHDDFLHPREFNIRAWNCPSCGLCWNFLWLAWASASDKAGKVKLASGTGVAACLSNSSIFGFFSVSLNKWSGWNLKKGTMCFCLFCILNCGTLWTTQGRQRRIFWGYQYTGARLQRAWKVEGENPHDSGSDTNILSVCSAFPIFSWQSLYFSVVYFSP